MATEPSRYGHAAPEGTRTHGTTQSPASAQALPISADPTARSVIRCATAFQVACRRAATMTAVVTPSPPEATEGTAVSLSADS
jgi:hypothetical protein